MKKQEKPKAECEHFVGASLYTDTPHCELCGKKPDYMRDDNGKIVGWKWPKRNH